MTITRVGTNQKYAEGWESAFQGKGGAKAAKPSGQKPSAKKKPAAKKAGKKSR